MEKDSAGIDRDTIGSALLYALADGIPAPRLPDDLGNLGRNRHAFGVHGCYVEMTDKPDHYYIFRRVPHEIVKRFPQGGTQEEAEADLVNWNGKPFQTIAGFTILSGPVDYMDYHATMQGYYPEAPERFPCFALCERDPNGMTVYRYLYVDALADMVEAVEAVYRRRDKEIQSREPTPEAWNHYRDGLGFNNWRVVEADTLREMGVDPARLETIDRRDRLHYIGALRRLTPQESAAVRSCAHPGYQPCIAKTGNCDACPERLRVKPPE